MCWSCPFAMLRCPIGQSGPLFETPIPSAHSQSCRSPAAALQEPLQHCSPGGCNRSIGSLTPRFGDAVCIKLIVTLSPRDAGNLRDADNSSIWCASMLTRICSACTHYLGRIGLGIVALLKTDGTRDALPTGLPKEVVPSVKP